MILTIVAIPILATGGGCTMETLVAFLVTVVGGVVTHYIIKWLDRDAKR